LLVGGQLARYYKLPYRGSGSLTNAKTADAQSAYETMWNLWPAVLAHTNLIMHAVGWLEGGLTASFEKFVIDLENLAMFRHFLEGFAVDEASLALDMIAEVGAGGHHFGTSHTQARYQTAFYQSSLADRQGYDSWVQGGGAETAVRANKVWKEMLQQYQRPPLAIEIEEALAEFVTRREQELEGKSLYD
jgi:trimethylamine--corrinoid protein Co-methyltransferase